MVTAVDMMATIDIVPNCAPMTTLPKPGATLKVDTSEEERLEECNATCLQDKDDNEKDDEFDYAFDFSRFTTKTTTSPTPTAASNAPTTTTTTTPMLPAVYYALSTVIEVSYELEEEEDKVKAVNEQQEHQPNIIPTATSEEWDNVTAQRRAEANNNNNTSTSTPTPTYTYAEAWAYLTLKPPNNNNPPTPSPTTTQLSFPARVWKRLFGPPELLPLMHESRIMLECLARTPLSSSAIQDVGHEAALAGVYVRLIGKNNKGFVVARTGPHWENIGFQGLDPGTDLRACGMLGLLQLLYLADTMPEFARRLQALSRHAEQHFPLAIVSLNVTKWALDSLRDNRLNAEANRRRDLVGVVNAFYAGSMREFHRRWVAGKCTMLQSGFVLKAVETFCKNNVGKLVAKASTAN